MLKNRLLFSFIFIGLIYIVPQVYAQSELIPRLVINQEFIENKTAVREQSGRITRISPGVNYIANSRKSTLTLDYSLDAIASNGLSQDDQINHQLELASNFAHIPNRWQSQINGNVRQANFSNDGIQNINPNLDTDNTRELRTLGANTDVNGQVSESVLFNTSLGVNYADFEDDENTEGYRFLFALNNYKTLGPFEWLLSFEKRALEAGDNDQDIDESKLNLTYQHTRKLSSFLNVTNTQTDNINLEENAILVGLNWLPSRNTSFRLGIGERGDDETYTLDATYNSKRSILKASYEELVTTVRDTTLNQLTPNTPFQGTGQSISIVPVFEKRTSLNWTLTGRRSNITVSMFRTERTQEIIGTEETNKGARLNLIRTLSSRSQVSLDLLKQKTKTTETNDLSTIELSYLKKLSKNLDYKISFRNTEQDSSNIDNEYDQKEIGILVTSTF